ncbi:hypothetical protein [Paenibacillus protaetiae]|uniref:hypothetical protein n=1 Tax=Paenibacillus protaetiae TaxID=2509456 RepID=UPI0013EB507D|nr:hypothetical protein [Paenibacillus protaetiae]
MEAHKGGVTAVIAQGTQLTSGSGLDLQLITSLDAADASLKTTLQSLLGSSKQLDSVAAAFAMGGNDRAEFDRYVTLTLAGMAGKQAAYLEQGIPHLIQKYANDSEGEAAGKPEYAYDNGTDLIIKTKHFTDYAAFTASDKEDNQEGGGSATPPDSKAYVTFSVDKKTIKLGYTVSPVKVELQPGDTVWTVFQRVLDGRESITTIPGLNNITAYMWNPLMVTASLTMAPAAAGCIT